MVLGAASARIPCKMAIEAIYRRGAGVYWAYLRAILLARAMLTTAILIADDRVRRVVNEELVGMDAHDPRQGKCLFRWLVFRVGLKLYKRYAPEVQKIPAIKSSVDSHALRAQM
jgi:hypothetical protein